ncbi:S-layer homology domain-containing protein [Candidatus Peregrinibacteria bacterium]|nr:S-layer homology domain-containing protein [Candidatus Peregrinibacteria bacterium]
MKKYFLLALSTLFLFTQNVAFALPTINSNENREFEKNAITAALVSITIQDDAETPFITAENDLRIHIPDDIAIIFDQFETGLNVSFDGTAVDSSKVLSTAKLSYEDKDKTLLVPVEQDFEAGDTLVIHKVYVEGFNVVSDLPANLELIYAPDQAAIKDGKTIIVRNSSNDDTTKPGKPTNVKITQTSNSTVKLSWELPSDLDLKITKILRGLNHLPVSSEPYKQVGATVTEFNDINLKIGDKVKYQLAVEDGPNLSDYTEIYEYTLVDFETIEVDEPEEPEAVIEEPINDEESIEEAIEEPIAEPLIIEVSFRDIEKHWAKDAIIEMAQHQVVIANSDGSFTPDRTMSRADASAYLYNVLQAGLAPLKPTEKPFSDVYLHKWYAPFIAQLKSLGLANGYSDGSFKPEDPVNRAEFLSLAMRVYEYSSDEETKAALNDLKTKTTDAYSDIPDDAWYMADINVATSKGFVNGKQCGELRCFDADALITRAEATTILHRMFSERF